MDRRDFMAGSTLAATLAGTSAAAAHEIGLPTIPDDLDAGMDRDRAAHVMAAAGIDALLLAEPVNIYYAAGNWPITTRMGVTGNHMVLLPRDTAAPITMITPLFTYYYTMAEPGLHPGVVPLPYARSARQLDRAGTDDGVPAAFWAVLPDETISERETRRRALTMRHAPFAEDLRDAIAKSVTALGQIGPIGVDTLEAAQSLTAAVPGVRAVPGLDTIKHIRVVKTPREIAMMRRGATANVRAAHDTAKQMRALGTHAAVRDHFHRRVAAHGNKPQFLVLDGVADEGHDVEIREGRSMLVDAVSHFAGYHGDYGRTVFIGEPRAATKRRVEAVFAAWTELREELRPGMRFSEVRARGSAILSGMGHTLPVPFGPHIVGLAHTEHPLADANGDPIDLAFEPGMVVSVDMPIMADDPGGTTHLEDLRVITADGSEAIHDDSHPYLIS